VIEKTQANLKDRLVALNQSKKMLSKNVKQDFNKMLSN